VSKVIIKNQEIFQNKWNPSVKLVSRQGTRRSPVVGNDPINKCVQPKPKKFEFDVSNLRAPQYDLKNGASRGFEFVSQNQTYGHFPKN